MVRQMAYCVRCRQLRRRVLRDRAYLLLSAVMILGIALAGAAHQAAAASRDATVDIPPPAVLQAAPRCPSQALTAAVDALRWNRQWALYGSRHPKLAYDHFGMMIILRGSPRCSAVLTGYEYVTRDGETWYAGMTSRGELVTGP